MRRAMQWAVMAALLALAALSAVGAFLGAESAAAFFASAPLAVYWLGLLALLVAGIFFFRPLLARADLFALHAGCAFVLVGAMYASDAGHRLRARLFAEPGLPRGYMVIRQGETERAILDDSLGREAGRLPFELKLDRFWIEYYPLEGPACTLYAAVADDDGTRDAPRWSTRRLEWQSGREIDLPHARVRARVLRYLPEGLAKEAPLLLVATADGGEATLPAEAGRELVLDRPKTRLQVTRVFRNLKVSFEGGEKRITDAEGPGENRAVEVRVDDGAGKPFLRYVFERQAMFHGGTDAGPEMRYLPSSPRGADWPAVELELSLGGRKVRRWLATTPAEETAWLALAPLFPEAQHDFPSASLALARLAPQVRDYKSRLVVLEDGRERLRKVVEVNHPLHYGGYHFYQHSYDDEHEAYTVLAVASDAGLRAVYLGFLMVFVGAAWRFWARPAWAWFRRDLR